MIAFDFARALGQLSDPRFTRVLWLGIGLSLALLLASYAGLLWLIDASVPGALELPLVGPVSWVGDLLGIGSLVLMMFLSTFLMVPVASFITSLFLDDVAAAVEDRHYADLPPVPHVGFWVGLQDTAAFFGLLAGANILAFFAYAAVPFLAPLVFYGLNGLLLGREYFTLAAARRVPRAEARALLSRNLPEIWFAGAAMCTMLTLPLVNLAIPVIGAATFTHLFHRLWR